jgi:hypothetical protein
LYLKTCYKFEKYTVRKNSRMIFNGLLEFHIMTVPNYREEVCTDPGKRDATLGGGGPGPPGKSDEQQFVPDSGGGET